jgi:tripartite-type tricarboxylate transporter receptor subunit TctC
MRGCSITRRDALRATALAAGAVLAASAVPAQTPPSAGGYPTRPVRIIVPFAAGGPSDIFARLIGQKLSDQLGKQFLEENPAGAGGNIGLGAAARAAPDGYTLAVVSSSYLVNPGLYEKIPYDPEKDFVPITIAAYAPNLLAVNPALPVTTVKELVALVRAHPATYNFGHSGVGTTPHLSGEIFRHSLGLDLVAVPFNGSGPALQSALGGHTPIAFVVLSPAVPLVRDGKMRALAVLSTMRSGALPEVPTIVEAGYPGLEADTQQCVLAPAGTSREIVDLIYRNVVAALKTPDMKERMATLGFVPVANTPAEFAKMVGPEVARWKQVITEANIKADP